MLGLTHIARGGCRTTRKRIMKTILILLLCLAGQCQASSDGIDDVLRLAKAGMTEEVLIAYVQNSQVAYNPNVDEIVFLNNSGIPQKVIAAMLERGKALREEAGTVATATPVIEAPPPAFAPAPPPVEQAAPIFSAAPPPIVST